MLLLVVEPSSGIHGIFYYRAFFFSAQIYSGLLKDSKHPDVREFLIGNMWIF